MARKIKDPRPSWDAYFMELATVVASRSNCSRRHVGAVVVRNRHILATGYNGTPYGVKNCFEGGCPRCSGETKSGAKLDECLCVHAEQNAIISPFAPFSVQNFSSAVFQPLPHSPNSSVNFLIRHIGLISVFPFSLPAEIGFFAFSGTPAKALYNSKFPIMLKFSKYL